MASDRSPHVFPPVPIDPDEAAKTAGQVGSHRSGWLSFQPLYGWIVAEQPDLLDD